MRVARAMAMAMVMMVAGDEEAMVMAARVIAAATIMTGERW